MELNKISKKKVSKILQYSDRIGTRMDPVCIQAAITDFCFNKCLNCDHHLREMKKIISGADWVNFLAAHKKIESVAYLGGDMMTHPDLNQILKYHVDNGVAFGIVTCGYIREGVDIELLSNARWFRVSLDTVNPDLYAKCRGGIPLDAVLSSIDQALWAGVNVGLEITVSRYNMGSLEDVFQYAISKAIAVEIHPCFGEEFTHETKQIIRYYEQVFNAIGIEFSFFCYSNFKFKKCVAPYYQIYVDSDGDIYPCCASSGDLYTVKNKRNMGNIAYWESFLDNRENHKMAYKACKSCCDNTTRINYVVESRNKFKNFF